MLWGPVTAPRHFEQALVARLHWASRTVQPAPRRVCPTPLLRRARGLQGFRLEGTWTPPASWQDARNYGAWRTGCRTSVPVGSAARLAGPLTP